MASGISDPSDLSAGVEQKPIGEVWWERRHGEVSAVVVSYPQKKDRIISLSANEYGSHDIAMKLLQFANRLLAKSVCL